MRILRLRHFVQVTVGALEAQGHPRRFMGDLILKTVAAITKKHLRVGV